MLVKEIMNKKVKTIEGSATVQEAAKIMNEHGIGSIIVVKGSQLVGIVTERDFLSKVIIESKDPTKTLVKDIMTKNVILVKPDLDAHEAVEIMHEKGIKKLPVISDKKVVGILTASDLCSIEPKFIEKLSALFLYPRKKRVAG